MDRQTDRWICTLLDRHVDSQRDEHTYITYINTYGQLQDGQIVGQTDRKIDIQTDREIKIQINRQIDR